MRDVDLTDLFKVQPFLDGLTSISINSVVILVQTHVGFRYFVISNTFERTSGSNR